MLSRLVTARRLESWGEDGPRMTAVPHEGELHVDGVFEALKGLVVIPLSTTDASGHGKEAGLGAEGGETKIGVSTILSVRDETYTVLTEKAMETQPHRYLDALKALGVTEQKDIDHALLVLAVAVMVLLL